MSQEEKKVKYTFGVNDTHCEADLFDTIEEVIEYAQASWDDKDGNPFDEDCDYSGCIYVGTAETYEPADFAPSLDDIADQMTDRFYNDHNIDDDQDVTYSKKAEAQKEWREFINKYFDIPHTIIANWNVGIYDLRERKWVERYDNRTMKKEVKNFASEVIDLGLPSGTLWAKCNLGAEKETDFGLFYQWGDTEGYVSEEGHDFNWRTYKWGTYRNLTKYNDSDGKTTLDNDDDPLWIATDGKFKMPTKEQLEELRDHTNHEWIEIDGVKGMKFTNKSDETKYIFIPAAGVCNFSYHDGVDLWGCVWSSSRQSSYPDNTWYMYFDSENVCIDFYDRCDGYIVRGVANEPLK